MLNKEQLAAKLKQQMNSKKKGKDIQFKISDTAAKHINKLMSKDKKK